MLNASYPVYIQSFPLFPDRNISDPIVKTKNLFIATQLFCRYGIDGNYSKLLRVKRCNVELNNIKAPACRGPPPIGKMIRAGRNESGVIAVRHAFNTLDVYVYSRYRISSGGKGGGRGGTT